MIRLYIQDLLELGVKKPIDKHANLVSCYIPFKSYSYINVPRFPVAFMGWELTIVILEHYPFN